MYTECETIELKQELTKNIKKEIVALANSKGGKNEVENKRIIVLKIMSAPNKRY